MNNGTIHLIADCGWPVAPTVTIPECTFRWLCLIINKKANPNMDIHAIDHVYTILVYKMFYMNIQCICVLCYTLFEGYILHSIVLLT